MHFYVLALRDYFAAFKVIGISKIINSSNNLPRTAVDTRILLLPNKQHLFGSLWLFKGLGQIFLW